MKQGADQLGISATVLLRAIPDLKELPSIAKQGAIFSPDANSAGPSNCYLKTGILLNSPPPGGGSSLTTDKLASQDPHILQADLDSIT